MIILKKNLMMLKYFIFSAIILFASCKSKDGDYTMFSPEDDVKMGAAMHQQIVKDKSFEILDSTVYKTAYQKLYSIRNAILESGKILHKDDFNWNIYLLRDDSMNNAFCTPGGYIYVYTGLINFLNSEDELAGVMGHEMAHADLRHSTDQLTKTYGLKVIVALIAGDDYSQFLDIGQNLLQLSFSRGDEKEADMKAVSYLCETKYNAGAFSEFFKRMEKEGAGQQLLKFLSTHPSPENRVENITAEWKSLCNNTGEDNNIPYKELKKSLQLVN